MNTTGTYRFKISNPGAGRYLLLCFAGLPFLFLLMIWHHIPYILLISLVFLPGIAGFLLLVKKEKYAETISIADDHLVSDRYGRIDFGAIVSAGPGSSHVCSLKLLLQSGKKIVWNGISKAEDHPDIVELKRFIAAFSAAVQQRSASETANQEEKNNPSEACVPETDAQSAQTPTVPPSGLKNLSHDLQEVRSTKHKTGRIAVLASLVILIIVLFQWLGPKIAKQRDEAALRPVREAITAQMGATKSLADSAKAVIAAYTKKNGPFYLLSNDTAAKLHYFPGHAQQLSGENDGRVKPLFQDALEAADLYNRIIHHPDSLAWHIGIEINGQGYLMLKQPLRFGFSDTYTYLYVLFLNPDRMLPKPETVYTNGAPEVKVDSVPMILQITIPLDRKPSLAEDIATGMQDLSKYIQHDPESYIYLTAQKGEGRMNEQLFKKSAVAFNDFLTKNQVDTTRFKIKIVAQ